MNVYTIVIDVSSNLLFNCPKSAVLYFWSNNNYNIAQYLLNNNIIDSRELIRIMITSNLSWFTHCNMAVSIGPIHS